MSCTNISLADLQFTIEEKDLYVKERELISQDEWLEQARKSLIENKHENDEEELSLERFSEEAASLESDENELQIANDNEEDSFENTRSKSVLTILSKYEEYKAECLKYMIPPMSFMTTIGEVSQLNLECLTLGDLHIRIILNHLLGCNLLQLTHMNLAKNPLSPQTCEVLAEYIITNTNLSHLVLRECLIGLEGVETLAESFAYSISLKYINLSKCDLNDAGGVVVVEAMQINDICKILDLSYNKLSSQTAAQLEVLLREKHTLEHLYLNWNNFYPEKDAIVKILKGLQLNQSLKELDLAWNGLTGKILMKFLLKALKENQSLEKLNLEYNLFTKEDIPGLIKAISKSQSLKHLSLKGNLFTREDILMVLSLFDLSPSLISLDIGKEFWHSDDFLSKASTIVENRPDVRINYQSKRVRKNPVPVKMKHIVVDRIHALSEKAMKNKRKKKRWDFADLMHDYKDLKKKGEDPITDKSTFTKTIFKEKRYKLEKNTIEHLMTEFPRVIPSTKPGRKPKIKIDLNKMSEYYLNRFKIPSRVIVAPVKKTKKGKKNEKKPK